MRENVFFITKIFVLSLSTEENCGPFKQYFIKKKKKMFLRMSTRLRPSGEAEISSDRGNLTELLGLQLIINGTLYYKGKKQWDPGLNLGAYLENLCGFCIHFELIDKSPMVLKQTLLQTCGQLCLRR